LKLLSWYFGGKPCQTIPRPYWEFFNTIGQYGSLQGGAGVKHHRYLSASAAGARHPTPPRWHAPALSARACTACPGFTERLSASAAESAYAAQKMARLGILAMVQCRPVEVHERRSVPRA
jgi:hypothetical protein